MDIPPTQDASHHHDDITCVTLLLRKSQGKPFFWTIQKAMRNDSIKSQLICLRFYDAKGKWGGKGMKGGGKGKDKGVDDAAAAAAAAAAAVPPGPEVPAVPAEGEVKPEAVVAEGHLVKPGSLGYLTTTKTHRKKWKMAHLFYFLWRG